MEEIRIESDGTSGADVCSLSLGRRLWLEQILLPVIGFAASRFQRGPEDAALHGARPVRPRRVQRQLAKPKRNGAPVLPLSGLVTLLQSAAREAAGRKTAIRDSGNQVGCHQL